jgi:hypothetical protein
MVSRASVWWTACLLWWAVTVSAYAGTVELRLDVDRLSEGQTSGISVLLTDGQPVAVPQIEAPAGLRIDYTGQSRNTSINNGAIHNFYKFRYEITALATGTYTLGPVVVEAQTRGQPPQTLRSNPVTLKVEPRPTSLPDAVSPVQIENGFSAESVWVGEVVIYRDVVRSRLEVVGSRWHNRPRDGLVLPRDGRPTRSEYEIQDAVGSLFVDETHVPFVAQRVGLLKFEAPLVELDVATTRGGGGLFGLLRRTQTTVGQGTPMTLEVRALPPPPAGFSGLVGDFQLSNRLDAAGAKVGKSIPWTIEIIGNGTLEGFELPVLGEVDGARIYEGSSQSSAILQRGAYVSSGRFPRTVVPTREGRLIVPAYEIITFSPKLGSYATLRVPQQEILVGKGEDGQVDLQSFAPEPSMFDNTEDDGGLRPLWRGGLDQRLAWERGGLQLGLLLSAAPALWLLLGLGRERWEARRSRLAAAPVVLTAKDLLRNLPEGQEARLAALDEALRKALHGATGGVDVPTDPDSLRAHLSPGQADEVVAVSHALDLARFAGAAPPADLEGRVRALVDALEAK